MARGAQITARIAEADAGVAVSAEVGHVEGLRLIKDDQEIAAIARAADMVDDALADVLAGGLVGRSEREVAFALQTRLFEIGAEGPSFEIIVAAGAERGQAPRGAGPARDRRRANWW